MIFAVAAKYSESVTGLKGPQFIETYLCERSKAKEYLVDGIVDGVCDQEEEGDHAVQGSGLDDNCEKRNVVFCMLGREPFQQGSTIEEKAGCDESGHDDVASEGNGVVRRPIDNGKLTVERQSRLAGLDGP